MLNIDLIKQSEKIKNNFIRYKILDNLISQFIPFNKGLGLKIQNISLDYVEVLSIKKNRRKNHIGGVHACALALMGEYPAGIYLSQLFPMNKYRLILSELNMKYIKQVSKTVYARANRPPVVPEFIKNEAWIYMETQLMNSKRENVAICKTKWQIKKWDSVQFLNHK